MRLISTSLPKGILAQVVDMNENVLVQIKLGEPGQLDGYVMGQLVASAIICHPTYECAKRVLEEFANLLTAFAQDTLLAPPKGELLN